MSKEKETTMQVPLEDWVKQIIRETVAQHSSHCPIKTIVEGTENDKAKSLIVRVDRIEQVLRLAAWLITPVYIAGAGFIVKEIMSLLGKVL